MAAPRPRKSSPPLPGRPGQTSTVAPPSPEPTTTVRPARRPRRPAPTQTAAREAPRRLLPVLLLLAMLGGVYACLALVTWSPLDPSFTRSGGGEVRNLGGPVGAWLADLLFQMLGYGAWLALPLTLGLGLRLAGRLRFSLGRGLAGLGLGWALLVVLALLAPATAGQDFPAGGIVGELSVESLRALVGPAGAWIVALGVALGSLPFLVAVRLDAVAASAVGGVEGAVPKVASLGLNIGRRAVGGVAAVGARVADRVRLARQEEDDEEEDEDEDEDEDLAEERPAPRAEALAVDTARPSRRPTSPEDPALHPNLVELDLELPAFARREGRATAWSDQLPPDAARGREERRTAASGRLLVEAEWDPTVAPGDVRDTLPAADLLGPPEPLVVAPASGAGLRANPRPRPQPSAERSFAAEPSSDPSVAGEPGSSPSPSAISGIDGYDLPEPASLPPRRERAADLPAPSASAAPASPARPAPPARPGAARKASITPGQLASGGGGEDRDLLVASASESFELPHLGLLDEHERDVARFDEAELQGLAEVLEAKLSDFGVKGEVVAIRPGPVVTTFEYVPAPGIKLSKISALSDDVAMALKALRVRIVAPIPGKGVVGIEIPNKTRQTVWLRDMLASEAFRKNGGALPMVLGKTVEGKPYVGNLAAMPHLLVGGTTGSGKSVGVNGMLLSMLYTRTPEELRLILIDPKMLEFELYRDIPHLLHPVVTEPKLASAALKWACVEMDERYRVLSRWGVRNITSFNKKLEAERADWSPEKAWRYAPADWSGDTPPPLPRVMPYIVIVIDELADLMMVAAKDVEESIIRLAQKARAAGIHLIVATQRPSVNVITGLIKANMPSRIAFQVRTRVDGRTILDQNGAENLLGKGDMLFLPPGVSDLERVHGPFVSDEEVRRVTDFLREQGSPTYEAQIVAEDDEAGESPLGEGEYDDLYDLAVAYVCRQGKASASMIQREFKIGYNRAARILEIMERDGVVGPADGARPREVLAGSHAS